jgi:RNA-binding protein YlmH
MNEHDEKNIKRFRELADRARQSSMYTYSSFHSAETAALVYEVAEENEITMWGGTENAERVVVRFGKPEEIGYEETFPIRILYVRPKQEKFADHLTHRDFLGAILNLGIERDVIGDILVTDRSAYFFVLEDMAEYICSGLERIKHTAVRCNIVEEVPPDCLPKLCEENVTVSSPRLDAILAKVYHLSRGEAKKFFDAEKITVNGRLCKNPEAILKESSKISVRGYGKLEYRGEEHTTKKGKTGITIWRYV